MFCHHHPSFMLVTTTVSLVLLAGWSLVNLNKKLQQQRLQPENDIPPPPPHTRENETQVQNSIESGPILSWRCNSTPTTPTTRTSPSSSVLGRKGSSSGLSGWEDTRIECNGSQELVFGCVDGKREGLLVGVGGRFVVVEGEAVVEVEEVVEVE
ncbi:hypothetical protein QBC44DRAFT_355878 [Cladorrhinum sp. PSN332]|nr:hypothetical protein QBC44DRAFT_355878 [Cladorrhinum sp. PSN332]